MATWLVALKAPKIKRFNLVIKNFRLSCLAHAAVLNGFDPKPDDIGPQFPVAIDVSSDGWIDIQRYLLQSGEAVAFANHLSAIPSLELVSLVHTIEQSSDVAKPFAFPILNSTFKLGQKDQTTGQRRIVDFKSGLDEQKMAGWLALANAWIKLQVAALIIRERRPKDDAADSEGSDGWSEEL